MRISDLFRYKSPKQQEKEMQAYRNWAFPYGDAQKKVVLQILTRLLPKEDPQLAMAIYLIAKEAYTACYRDEEETAGRTREDKLADARRVLRDQLPGKKKADAPLYLALLCADETVDESLLYPSAETLRYQAESL